MTTLIVLGAAALVWWIGTSLYDPWVDCWWCNGSPKRRAKRQHKHYHFCLICDATGRRRRFWSVVFGRGLGKL